MRRRKPVFGAETSPVGTHFFLLEIYKHLIYLRLYLLRPQTCSLFHAHDLLSYNRRYKDKRCMILRLRSLFLSGPRTVTLGDTRPGVHIPCCRSSECGTLRALAGKTPGVSSSFPPRYASFWGNVTVHRPRTFVCRPGLGVCQGSRVVNWMLQYTEM